MPKTQYSLSHHTTKLTPPSHFILTIPQLKPSIPARFILPLTRTILTIPPLPKQPPPLQIHLNQHPKPLPLF
ncbi:formate--tetrahydrofolate ligase [Bacillus mycoides]|uniref:formate--tetrahydrofolate ligase n=1 Tax=Bacillus mycoides TaxID=1405 RepID=UPI003CC7D9A9